MRRKRATDAVALADPASRTAGESRPWFGFTIGTDVSPGVFTSRFAGPEQTVLVLGPPRSGKTSSIVIPSIWQAPSAVVSTSTKPDVLLATCTQRQEFGT